MLTDVEEASSWLFLLFRLASMDQNRVAVIVDCVLKFQSPTKSISSNMKLTARIHLTKDCSIYIKVINDGMITFRMTRLLIGGRSLYLELIIKIVSRVSAWPVRSYLRSEVNLIREGACTCGSLRVQPVGAVRHI